MTVRRASHPLRWNDAGSTDNFSQPFRAKIMPIFDRLSAEGFREVVFCNDNDAGLRAIIAIHDTTLGPALGGVRMRPFATEEEALVDVLRLARGMTYKAAISGVDLGGGKSVIIGDSRTAKSEVLLEAMGRFIHDMGGRYIAGQDIGTDSHDMAVIRRETPHVACVPKDAGGAGDPSFATAFGVTAGIRAVLKVTTGDDALSGRHVAIQGVGHVGYFVAKYCHEAGAKLTVTDVARDTVQRAANEFSATVIPPEEIYQVDCDIFAPCSVGAVVNDATIPRLRCKGIAGAANNVLAEPRHGYALMEREIVYGPDYLVNSGGLIRCQEEVRGGEVDDEKVLAKVSRIYDQTLEVIRTAEEQGISPADAADRMAEERIARARAAAAGVAGS